MNDAGNTNGNKATLTPPYTSFPTIKTLLKSFQEHGTPGRIDRSVLTNFSGSVGAQIIPALRFLRLIDAANIPTESLKTLVAVVGTEQWSEELLAVLRETYAPLWKLDLQTASPSQFDELFTKSYPTTDDVVRKCKSFYLAAATDAKIPISPYILRSKKPRSGTAKKRATKTAENKQNGGGQSGSKRGVAADPPATERRVSEHLLAVLDDTGLEDKIRDAVLVLLPYLRQKGK
jgi:hypothetical protein